MLASIHNCTNVSYEVNAGFEEKTQTGKKSRPAIATTTQKMQKPQTVRQLACGLAHMSRR
jgi:hypothetical protein